MWQLITMAMVLSGSVLMAAEGLIGRWSGDDGSGFQIVADLSVGGKGTLDGEPIVWQTNEDQLIMTQDGMRIVYRYKLTGNRLVLRGGDLEDSLVMNRLGGAVAAAPAPADVAVGSPPPSEVQASGAHVARKDENILARIAGPKPALPNGETLDNELSGQDVDASLELLCFLWVCAGRNPAYITPEALLWVRGAIVQSFAQMPVEAQYCFANAVMLNPQVQTAWRMADQGSKAAMARQFAQSLDELGLTDPDAPVPQRSAWSSSESEWEIKSGLMMNTCWNLAQKSTR